MYLTEHQPFVLPAIGRPDPLANAFKTGTEADCPRVPDDAIAVNARATEWYMTLKPQNHYHAWLVDQIADTSLRIEHVGRVERRARDRSVIRAELTWDDDRRLGTEELGDRLALSPPKVVNQLRRAPHGCDWMIDRWARLARIADVSENRWDDSQRSLAFDLLGARPEDRLGHPGETIDLEGRLVASITDLAALARREVAGLLIRKAEVAPLDAVNRTMARSDYADRPTPEVRDLRRDAALHGLMKWHLAQINLKGPRDHTDPKVYKHFLRDIGFGPPPTSEPPPPMPDVEVEVEEVAEAAEPAPDVEAGPVFHLDRHEAKLKKAEARRGERRRKLERLRA